MGPSRHRVVPALTVYLLYRGVRFLLIDDPVGSATVALTADFLLWSVLNWLLLGVTIYAITVDVDSPMMGSVWSRLAVAGIAVWYAREWHQLYNPTGALPPTIESFALTLAAGTVLSFSVLVLMTGNTHKSVVLTVAGFLLGYVLGILTATSPVPEILLGGAVFAVAIRMVLPTEQMRLGPSTVDLEGRVGTAVVRLIRSEKGGYALLLVLTGIVTALVPVLAVVWAHYIGVGGEATPEGVWPTLVTGVVFGAYSAYGVWYWLGMLRRVPAFLADGCGAETERPRPRGYFLPASAYAVGGLILVAEDSLVSLTEQSAVVVGPGLMLVGLAWMGHSVYQTTANREGLRATGDGRVICVAFLVQHVPFFVLSPSALFAFTIVFLPVAFYIPDIRDVSENVASVLVAVAVAAFVALYLITVGRALEAAPLLSTFTLTGLLALLLAVVHSVRGNSGDVSSAKSDESEPFPAVVGVVGRKSDVSRRAFLTHGSAIVGIGGAGWALVLRETSGPTTVAKAFFVAMYDGDTETVRALLHERSPDGWLLVDGGTANARRAELDRVEALLLEEDGDTAEVSVELHVLDHASGEEREEVENVELRQEDDEWRVYRLLGSDTPAETVETDIEAPWMVFEAEPEHNDGGELVAVEWTRTGGDRVELSRVGAWVSLAEHETDPITLSSPGELGEGTLHEGDSFRIEISDVDAVAGDELELFWSAEDSTTRRPGPRYTFQTATAGTGGASIGDVSTVRYDAANTGYAANGRGPNTEPSLQWDFEGRAGITAGPVIVDGTLYVAGIDRVYALDAEFGTEQWSVEVDWPSAPTVVDGTVYVGGRVPDGRAGQVHAFDAATGEHRWSTRTEERLHARPTVSEGSVYVIEQSVGTFQVYALDTADGTERWRTERERVPVGALAVHDGSVYLASSEARTPDQESSEHKLSSLDTTDGSERWQTVLEAGTPTSPVVTEGFVCVPVTEDSDETSLHSIDKSDGSVQWSVTVDGSIEAPPAVDGDSIYLGTTEFRQSFDESPVYRLLARDIADGSDRWTVQTRAHHIVKAPPTVVSDTVYAPDAGGSLRALDVADGSDRWSVTLGSAESVVVVDGRVYALVGNRLECLS